MPILRYRIEATVNEKEYNDIRRYIEKQKKKGNDISIYKLVKEAVLEKINKSK